MFRTLLFAIAILVTPIKSQAQRIFNQIVPEEDILIAAKKVFSSVNHYDINIPVLTRKLNTSEMVEIEIPVGKRIKTILFEKTNILTPDYQLYLASGIRLNTSRKYSFYRGSVLGEANSNASMIFYDDVLSINIFDDDGNYEINKLGELYTGYFNRDRQVPVEIDWECNIIDASNAKTKVDNIKLRSNSSPECVTIFFEIDHDMYLKQGSDIAVTEAWFLTLFLQVSIFYIEHNVPINISGIQVWDVEDPYITATNTSAALNLFKNTVQSNPNFNGRLAHLVSGRFLGGGLAFLNSLCSSSINVAVSYGLNGGNIEYPTYSRDVMVVTHEIGHNMGSPHTQACAWNGNNTAIDGCGNIEGNCPNPGDPPLEIGGTIMSYCHLTPSGINFANGFGPQPGALIEEKFLTAPCVTGENCSFVTPFNDICDRSKELPLLNYCIKDYFNNYKATPSGDGGNMSCGDSGIEKDVWYQFNYVAADTIHLIVEASEVISDIVVEIYSGECGNLTPMDCGYSANGGAVSFKFHDPNLIDETLFIRIVEKGSDEEGVFSICLYSEILPCQNQVSTLLNIYQKLDGTNWTNNSGWIDGVQNGTCEYCDWYGVTCDYLGRIKEIDLSTNNLQGKLPNEFTALTYLERLSLHNNFIMDTIPNYWDSLGALLYLDLRFNFLTGSIPLSFNNMARINSIHLDNNLLDGPFPKDLGFNSVLQTFTASNNFLEGCFTSGSSLLCGKDSINFSNNPDLPYAGDLTLLCENGWGTDWDLDGYCNNVEDCNDFDSEINPGVVEILCDAIDNNCNHNIDEGSNFGPNVWIGPDTLGSFEKPGNWSLNHVPLICENIEIGMQGGTIDLVLTGNETPTQLKVRNLSIGAFTTLHLPAENTLSLLGNGVIENNGTFYVSGSINIQDQLNTLNTAFLNHGRLHIGSGSLNISEIGDLGLYNSSSGIVELYGFSYLASQKADVAKNAIINEGVINIFGFMVIQGVFIHNNVTNINGGTIEVKNGGFFSIY